jgi:RimJ/RimL family protein N-acetyltransferase
MIVAWGEQVALRPFEDPISDAEIARLYDWSRDPDLLRWSGGSPTPLTFREFADQFRHDQRRDHSGRQVYLIVTREGKLIGRVGCFAIDWSAREGELGIVIGDRDYQGRGYGRDAIDTLLEYLFETTPLENIRLFTFQDNARAQKTFAACGFRVLGTARRFDPDAGEYDGVEMQVTRQEFYGARRLALTPRVERSPLAPI